MTAQAGSRARVLSKALSGQIVNVLSVYALNNTTRSVFGMMGSGKSAEMSEKANA